jgi:hypothetical protein
MTTNKKTTTLQDAGRVTAPRAAEAVRRGEHSSRAMANRDVIHIITPSKTKYQTDILGLPLFNLLKPRAPYRLSILETTILDHLVLRANEFEDNRPGETDCYINLDDLYKDTTPTAERKTAALETYKKLQPEMKKEFKRTIKNAVNGIRDKIKVGDVTLEDDDRVIVLGCGFERGKDRLVTHLHPGFAAVLKDRQIETFLAHDTGHFDEYHRVEHKIYRYFQDDANKNRRPKGRDHLIMATILDHVIDIVKENEMGNDRHTTRRIIKRLIDALEYLAGRGGKGENQPPTRIEYKLFLDSMKGRVIEPADAYGLPLNRVKELRVQYKILNTDAPTKEILLEQKNAKDAERDAKYKDAFIEENERKKREEKRRAKITTNNTPPSLFDTGVKENDGLPPPTPSAA